MLELPILKLLNKHPAYNEYVDQFRDTRITNDMVIMKHFHDDQKSILLYVGPHLYLQIHITALSTTQSSIVKSSGYGLMGSPLIDKIALLLNSDKYYILDLETFPNYPFRYALVNKAVWMRPILVLNDATIRPKDSDDITTLPDQTTVVNLWHPDNQALIPNQELTLHDYDFDYYTADEEDFFAYIKALNKQYTQVPVEGTEDQAPSFLKTFVPDVNGQFGYGIHTLLTPPKELRVSS